MQAEPPSAAVGPDRLQLVAAGAGVGLWDWDVATDALYLSARWKAQLGYAADELPSTRAAWLSRLHPEDAAAARAALADVIAGSAPDFELEHRLRHRDGSWRWMLVRGAVLRGPGGRPIRIAGSQTDITAQKAAERASQEHAALYARVVNDVGDGVLIVAAHGAILAANPAICRMYHATQAELLQRTCRQLFHPEDSAAVVAALESSAPPSLRVRSLRKDGSVFRVELRQAPVTMHGHAAHLLVVRDLSDQFSAHAELEQRVAERTRELAMLLEISRDITSTLDLRPLLHRICQHVAGIVHANSASIMLIEDGSGRKRLEMAASLGTPELVGHHFDLLITSGIWPRLLAGEGIIVSDVRGDEPHAQAYRETVGDLLDSRFHYVTSLLMLPLVAQSGAIGFLSMSHMQPNYFTQHHAGVVTTIANQAAIAIENARLHAQALTLATLEERQRLARELHDSVSQALYGIALGARTARTLLERDPARASEPLEYVLALAEAGLAEMRALIFELRPESLEQEGLVAALEKQAAALRARQRVDVHTSLPVEPPLSLAQKEAFYRIAQEAMHNIIKHARATRIELELTTTPHITLCIRDNGIGFDASGSFPGHLGLHSMRERAERAGATLSVTSTPGVGTTVQVVCG